MDKKLHKVKIRCEHPNRGSITVEMSMIFPIVMYVIFSIIYAGMYLHDYVTIHQAIDEIVLECNTAAKYPMESDGEHINYSCINDRGVFFIIDSDYSIEDNIYSQRLMELLKNRLFITIIEQPKVDIAYTKITASTKCIVKIPFKSVRVLLGEDRLNYSQTSEAEVFHPAEFVRKFTVLSNLVEGTQIGDESLKKLRGIIKGGK